MYHNGPTLVALHFTHFVAQVRLRKKEDQNDLNETWLSQTRFAVSSSLSTILVCTCTGVNVKIDSGFQAASRICPMSEKWKNNTGNS